MRRILEHLGLPTTAPTRAPARSPPEHITTFNALRNSGARPGDTVSVLGTGGLGHLAIQYASKLGFRTVALSRGAAKEKLARELGAHDYVDTQRISAAEGLQRLGGAHLVLTTAPHAEAIASALDGLTPRGKLLIVAAPVEPMQTSAFTLLSGKTVAGWPSGTAVDSEDTLALQRARGRAPPGSRFSGWTRPRKPS